jgi:hypothetical protein
MLSSGAQASATPTAEPQMGLGELVYFQDGIVGISLLQVDYHYGTISPIVDQASLALQFIRGRHNQNSLNTKSTISVQDKIIDAFNLAIIKGVREIMLGDNISSIAIGNYVILYSGIYRY